MNKWFICPKNCYNGARVSISYLYFVINRSECDHLLYLPTLGGDRTVINRHPRFSKREMSATCFALGDERYASSSRLMVLSLLGNKDGTRTIEMILVSTVLLTKVSTIILICRVFVAHLGKSLPCACARYFILVSILSVMSSGFRQLKTTYLLFMQDNLHWRNDTKSANSLEVSK